MNIAGFDVYRFRIPFVTPIKVGHVVLHEREGFVVVLTDRQGRRGFGEIAPLPGLDKESLDDCRNDLSVLRKQLGKCSFNTDQFDIASPAFGMMDLPAKLNPHTLFGLESALMSLYLQEAPLSLPDTINIPVNGLFIADPNDEQVDVQIQALLARGMKTVKVKIGRLPADQEIHQILRLADAVGSDLRLRLDGNRSLSSAAYSHYYSTLRHLNVEYAEEPLRAGESLQSGDVPWPIALDESLPRYIDPTHSDAAGVPPNIQTVILKPGLLSGLSGMAGFIASARKRCIRTVLSSSFNTGVTLANLGAFSQILIISDLSFRPDMHRVNIQPEARNDLEWLPACAGKTNRDDTNSSSNSLAIAFGFDTLRYLQADVIVQSPAISGGAITIPRNMLADMSLNVNVLSREDL